MKYIFILSFFLFQLPIYSSVGFADLIIFLLNIYYLVFAKIKFPKANYKKLTLIFFFWLIISPIFLSEFDGQLFVNRILRVSNVLLGVLIIPRLLFKRKDDLFKYTKFLCFICGLLFILVVIEFIYIQYDLIFDIRLIGRDFTKIPEVYSIYSEPSILALVLVFSNYIIFYTKNIFNKSKDFFRFFIIINSISILLTFSFIGIVGLLLILIFRSTTKQKIYILSPIIMLLFLIEINNTFIRSNFIDRFENIINKEDNSANQRLIGAWTAPFLHLENLYIGSGTGHEMYFFEKAKVRSFDNISMNNQKINNSLAVVFLENGIIGLAIFLLLILSFYKVNKFLPALILYYSFSHGEYFSAFLWLFIILFISFIFFKKNQIELT